MQDNAGKVFTPERFIRRQRFGILSTHSHAVPGYPFGSVTPYIITNDGKLAILISTIAQHTKNIAHNNRVSLTIFDPADAHDPQAGARLTWISNAIRTQEHETKTVQLRYIRFFPYSADYDKTHDFNFYVLELVKARYIGGFGDIHWIEKSALHVSNPLADIESHVLDHMNTDHRDALANYCLHYHATQPSHVVMVGIDATGFDMLADNRLLRTEFEQAVTTVAQARAVLVDMANTARSATL